jgi:hypothetical protein
MFGFGVKKSALPKDPSKLVGLELNASLARAVALGELKVQPLHLDGMYEELPLAILLEGRTVTIGHSALARSRHTPHAICSGYLGHLGQSREWRVGRNSLTPETATQAALDKIRTTFGNDAASLGLALPAYLTQKQAKAVLEAASLAKLVVSGSVAAPLAIAAHRAGNIGPGGTVLIFDADDHALSASLITVYANEVRLVGGSAWPQASLRLWKDRLIDGIADRCVRVCRRDPRDSAEAEQSIFDQLDAALDAVRVGQKFTMSLRCEHWYQDLVQLPDDLERTSQPMLLAAVEGLKQLLLSQALPMPPRAIWFSHAAGRLPGLVAKLYRHSPEQTAISILPPNAGAEAVAALVPRFLEGRLPRTHIDVSLPWQRIVSSMPVESFKPIRGISARQPEATETR